MKELELLKPDTELSVKQQKQVEHELLFKITPHNGHSIWEIDTVKLTVKKAEYSNTTYHLDNPNKKEILVKKDCFYVSALNAKNAAKKYLKNNIGAKLIFEA